MRYMACKTQVDLFRLFISMPASVKFLYVLLIASIDFELVNSQNSTIISLCKQESSLIDKGSSAHITYDGKNSKTTCNTTVKFLGETSLHNMYFPGLENVEDCGTKPILVIKTVSYCVDPLAPGILLQLSNLQWDIEINTEGLQAFTIELFSKVVPCNSEYSVDNTTNVNLMALVLTSRLDRLGSALPQMCDIVIKDIPAIDSTLIFQIVEGEKAFRTIKINDEEFGVLNRGEALNMRNDNGTVRLHSTQAIVQDFALSFRILRCTELPPDVENARPSLPKEPWLVNTQVSYSCKGEFLRIGSLSSRCAQTFSSNSFSTYWTSLGDSGCGLESCFVTDASFNIPNGNYQPKDYLLSETLEYWCDEGYKPRTVVSCRIGSIWTGTPMCVRSCDEPGSILNGEVIERGSTPYFEGEELQFKCDNGYEMEAAVLCEGDSTWSGDPLCKSTAISMSTSALTSIRTTAETLETVKPTNTRETTGQKTELLGTGATPTSARFSSVAIDAGKLGNEDSKKKSTTIGIVVPVVVIALGAVLGIFLKRRQLLGEFKSPAANPDQIGGNNTEAAINLDQASDKKVPEDSDIPPDQQMFSKIDNNELKTKNDVFDREIAVEVTK